MPVILIPTDKSERLAYRPDAAACQFRSMPQELLDAIRALMVEVTALNGSLPPGWESKAVAIPPVLQSAMGYLYAASLDDAVFYYQRLPGPKRAELLFRHTSMGMLDFHSARWAMGAEALVGWENVRGADGEAIPFDKKIIPYLPGNIVSDIGVLVDDNAPEDYLKNFVGSLNGALLLAASTATLAGAN